MSDTLMRRTDAEWDAEMDAVSTVYSLRPGMTLTDAHYQAIQTYDESSRRDQDRSVDAFHKGYQQGLREGGSADVAELTNRISELGVDLATQKAMRTFDEKRLERLVAVLEAAAHTLTVHGKMDGGTPLHERITAAVS